MTSIQYVRVHKHLAKHTAAAGVDRVLLRNPMPIIGTLSPFLIRVTKTGPGIIRKGETLRIFDYTQGKDFFYTVSQDFEPIAPDTDQPLYVSQLIQAVHLNLSTAWVPLKIQSIARNVIQSVDAYGAFDNLIDTGYPEPDRKCAPYVRPWPWAADPLGIPWDQANLLMLSFYPINGQNHRMTLTDEQGLSDVIPVPKLLPSGYTEQTPRTTGAPAGYYGDDTYNANNIAITQFRTATAIKNRLALASIRFCWQCRAQSFPDPATAFSTMCYGENDLPIYNVGGRFFSPSSSNAVGRSLYENGPFCSGVRGGHYAVLGQCWNGVTLCGMTVNVMLKAVAAEYADAANVLLTSFHVSTGLVMSNAAWTGIVAAPTFGETCDIYCELIPDVIGAVPAHIPSLFQGAVRAHNATNVPWVHTVITGNLVAPGGLIAPFY